MQKTNNNYMDSCQKISLITQIIEEDIPQDLYAFLSQEKISNTDAKITNILGIPTSTLQDWKKRDNNNWRKKLYHFLKQQKLDK